MAAQNLSHHQRKTDASVASESSESSRFSRFSTATSHRHSKVYHPSQLQQQHSASHNSLFCLGASYSNNNVSSGANSTVSPLITSNDDYQKHHHNEPSMSFASLLYAHHQQSASSAELKKQRNNTPSSPISPQLPPLPSLRVIGSELLIICSLYCRYTWHSCRKPCRKFRQRLLYGGLMVVVILILLSAWILTDFYMDAVTMCTPPPGSLSPHQYASFLVDIGGTGFAKENDDDDEDARRPLVEYYVHGRGIGHYARSVAIVERLNRAGIDVRMFLTRAALWRAMHEDAKSMLMVDDADDVGSDATFAEVNGQEYLPKKRGKTTAISVTSITPNQSYSDVVSTVVERVSGDCEVSASSGRYPQLVISDGDFPGMLRAELGGIPSVGIAHGQLFSIAQKPAWVKNVPYLNRAWNKQGTLNYVSGLFTEWQIATHFCFLESKYASGTVARAPLRPEVLQMANARRFARDGKVYHRRSLPQAERVRELLLENSNSLTSHNTSNVKPEKQPQPPRRKLVICYFRDRNGEIVVRALLDAGFDVLLFDNGYNKDMASDPSRYGVKWIVANHEKERQRHIRSGEDRRMLSHVDNNFDSSRQGRRSLTEHEQNVGPKLIRVQDRSLFVPLMHVADGVASSAGSQLMSECIYSHMPLYALYKEADDEQRLNVELSHHMDAPCHRPLVFGTSFESLTYALRTNVTQYATQHSRSPILESLASFIKEVQSSKVSETFYRNVDLISSGVGMNVSAFEQDKVAGIDDEDPFRGLPDAAAIIMEIVKQVIQKS
jgi:hypothetical protein